MPCPPAENVPVVVVVSTSQFVQAAPALYWSETALPPVRYHRVMLPTPVPFPSEAVYQTQNVRTFSYVGKAPAADVGASLSTITNDSVWLVPMLTDRGSLANE